MHLHLTILKFYCSICLTSTDHRWIVWRFQKDQRKLTESICICRRSNKQSTKGSFEDSRTVARPDDSLVLMPCYMRVTKDGTCTSRPRPDLALAENDGWMDNSSVWPVSIDGFISICGLDDGWLCMVGARAS
jgi:hypothetical protein